MLWIPRRSALVLPFAEKIWASSARPVNKDTYCNTYHTKVFFCTIKRRPGLLLDGSASASAVRRESSLQNTGNSFRITQRSAPGFLCVCMCVCCVWTNEKDLRRVKSKETVGNSWTVLKVILGHKHHHNHSMRSVSTEYSQNPQQKMIFFIYFCLWLSVRVGACCPLRFDLVSQ